MSATKRIAEISNKIKELNSNINKIRNPTGSSGNTRVYSRELDDKLYELGYQQLLREETIRQAREEKNKRRGGNTPYSQNRNLSIEERRAAVNVSRYAREGGYTDGITEMEQRASLRIEAHYRRQRELRKWQEKRRKIDEEIARQRAIDELELNPSVDDENQEAGKKTRGRRRRSGGGGRGGSNDGYDSSDESPNSEGSHSRWVRGVGRVNETDKERIEREKKEQSEEEAERRKNKEGKEFSHGIKTFAKATDKFSKTIVDAGHGSVFGAVSGIGRTLMSTGNPIAMLGGALLSGGSRVTEMMHEKFRNTMTVGSLAGGDASLGEKYQMHSGLSTIQKLAMISSGGLTGLLDPAVGKYLDTTGDGTFKSDEIMRETAGIAFEQGKITSPAEMKYQVESSLSMKRGWYMNNSNKRGLFWARGGRETYESDIKTALNTLSSSSVPRGYEGYRPGLNNLARNEQISQNLYGTQNILASRNAKVSNNDAVGYMAAFQSLGGSGIDNRMVSEMNNMVQSTALGGTEMKQIFQMNTAKRVAASQLKREQGNFTWEEMMSKAYTMAQKGTDREYLAEYVKGANQMGGNNPWASKLIYGSLFDQMSPDAVDSLMKNQEGFRKELLGNGNTPNVFNDQALSEAVERMTTTFDKTGNKLSTAISLLAEILGL